MTDEERRAQHDAKEAAKRAKRTAAMREYRRLRKLDPEREATHRAKEVARVSAYKKRPDKVDGVRAYYAKRARDSLAKIRAWLAEYKMSRGCADCGYNQHPAALDFDHVGDDKLFTISQCQNFEAVKLEVQKCVVRCSNCHRVVTHLRLCERLGIHDALTPLEPRAASSLP